MFDPRVDRPGLVSGVTEFVLGATFFPFIFYSLTTFLKNSSLGRQFCEHFGIQTHGVLDIGNKLTSSTFAFLACLTGITVAKQCNSDVLNERYYILDNYLIFGFSYFFYDVVSMYMVYSTEHKEEVTWSVAEVGKYLAAKPLILFHHICVPLVGFPVLMHFRGGTGDCLLGTSFLIEASTPFVSLRVILVHLNMKDTRLYVANGLAMLGSFFLCRVMLFPYLYCWYASVLDQSLVTTLATLPLWVHCVVMGLWGPQLIWFNRMLKGSIKLIKDRKRTTCPPEKTTSPSEHSLKEANGGPDLVDEQVQESAVASAVRGGEQQKKED